MVRNKNNIIVIYADSWEDLTVKMMGYYHDHCYHYYSGHIEALPSDLHYLIYKELKIGPVDEKRYIFICEEDEPLKRT